MMGWGTTRVVVQEVGDNPPVRQAALLSLAAIEIWGFTCFDDLPPSSFPAPRAMAPSSRPPQRRSSGYGSFVLAAAGLAAATGIALWYLREHNLLDRIWGGINNRQTSRTKRSVVVIVDNVSVSLINMDPTDIAPVYRQQTTVLSRVPGIC